MASPEIARRLNNEGADHWDVTPGEFRNCVVAEIVRWKGVIEAANIRVE
jgi:tripartite-type tricarboxylate transporter receptor subunit TctC